MLDSEGPWLLYMHEGRLVSRRPWCDCKPAGFGLVKVAEGRWGRPCCRRPVNLAQWEKWQRDDAVLSQNQTKEEVK